MSRSVLKKAITDTFPVLTGYLVIGLSFGIVLSSRGYGPLWAAGSSLFIYAGTMQFVAVELMCSGASLLTTALTTLAVNMRHLFYGLSMIERYRDTGKAKPYLIFGLTDETFSLVCAPTALEPGKEKLYYFLVTLFDQLYWVLGSVLGCALGSVLPFNTKGIDFALTALFVSVVTEQWLSSDDHVPVLMSIGISVLCRLIFGADQFLIPAIVLIWLGLTLYRKRAEGKA